MSRRMKNSARNGQTEVVSTPFKITFQKQLVRKATKTYKRPVQKRKAATISDADSTSSGNITDQEDLEDGSDDADDESGDAADVVRPAALPRRSGVAGIHTSDPETDSDTAESDGFPDFGSESANVVDEERLFESDDDLVYERVNEVSDSEADDEAVEKAELSMLTNEFEAGDDDLTSHFANQIDGMSAYGFGSDSDNDSVLMPFSSSDEANAGPKRVHFAEQPPMRVMNAFSTLTSSPTMTRALLPSALPEPALGISGSLEAGNAEDSDVDSDATEELEAPAEKWQCKAMLQPSPIILAQDQQKRPSGMRGPVRGTFEDAGDKVTAILDPTGKKLLMSDPHLLGGVFARRYGPSAPVSPSMDFNQAVFGDDSSEHSQASGNSDDVIVAANGIFKSSNVLMPELSTHSSTASFLNEMVEGEMFSEADEIDRYEAKLSIDDMIKFDDDDSDEATSPIFNHTTMSAPVTPRTFNSFNNMNISAFKHSTQPKIYRATPQTAPLINKFTTPLKRKRKDRHDSPYNDKHYKGVTPVQRVTYDDAALISSPVAAAVLGHKRRKTIL